MTKASSKPLGSVCWAHPRDLLSSQRLGCLGILLGCVFLISACAPTNRRGPDPLEKPANVEQALVPVPPWQTWDPLSGTGSLRQAGELVLEGRPVEAAKAYKNIWARSEDRSTQMMALTRWSGEKLKVGDSKAVLDQTSRYLKGQRLKIEDASPELMFVISYAYLHRGDKDQNLAWLSLAHRRAGGDGKIALSATEEAKRQLRTIPEYEFQDYSSRWSTDSYISSLFAQERFRRVEGGEVERSIAKNFFRADAYVPGRGFVEEELIEPQRVTADGMKIGVLLPLTGQYASHAQRVKRGIELAAAEFPGVTLSIGDTAGSEIQAGKEFRRLVSQEGVSLVLGPLLLSTTKAIFEESRQLETPFLTFTKRPGIPELGDTVFRLGVTYKDQVRDLVNYSTKALQKSRFGIIYPETSVGQEYYELFREEVRRQRGTLLPPENYRPRDGTSMRSAAARILDSQPEVVFLPDSLEHIQAILEVLSGDPTSSPLLLGPAFWDDPVAIRGLGQYAEGAIYVSPFYRTSADPRVGTFISAYRSRFKSEPDLLAAQSYDAATVVFRELEGPELRPTQLIRKLQSAPAYQGVTGNLQVTPTGEIRRTLSILQLQNGEVVEVFQRRNS